jgi:hypothetical protein
MNSEEKSFKELVKEAPVGATVSLVGALAQSSEEGKFVLTLQDGRAITMETASVKGHAVLGTSVGHTIVRIDVDAGALPAVARGEPGPVANFHTAPGPDYTLAWLDHGQKPLLDSVKSPWTELQTFPYPPGAAPFALATPHQVAAQTLAMMIQPGPFGIVPERFTFGFFDLPAGGGTTPGHPTSDV